MTYPVQHPPPASAPPRLTCPDCDGTGWVRVQHGDGYNFDAEECPFCGGSGGWDQLQEPGALGPDNPVIQGIDETSGDDLRVIEELADIDRNTDSAGRGANSPSGRGGPATRPDRPPFSVRGGR